MKSIFTPKNKKMIFFDMNQTLVNKRASYEQSFVNVLSQFTARWHQDDDTGYHHIFKQYTEEWKKGKLPAETITERRIRCLGKAMQQLPIAVTESFGTHFFNEVEEAKLANLQLYPGAKDTLEKLASSYQLAVISNSNKNALIRQIEHLQLGVWFPPERLFTAQRSKMRKPDATMFRRSLRHSGVAAHEAVMMGNSWKNDVYGARRSGIDAIWFRPASKTKFTTKRIGKDKIYIIRKWSQLLDLFEIQ